MFTAFMVDGSNIMKFEAADNNITSGEKYGMELWIFKPRETVKQVGRGEYFTFWRATFPRQNHQHWPYFSLFLN